MKTMRSLINILPTAMLAASCLLAPHTCVAQAQDPAQQEKTQTLRLLSADVLRGKQLLEAGDAEGAAKVLGEAVRRNARDSAAWHYLGLALTRAGKTEMARNALERAVNLRANAFNMELNMQLRRHDELSKEESDARRVRFVAVTRENVESVESFITLASDEEEFWRAWLETLRLYQQFAADPKFDSATFKLSQFATRAVIISKSEPMYTKEARRSRTRGNIMLRVMLNGDGTVGSVLVTKSLGSGLDESAVAAARLIRFTPASLNGRPVSQIIMMEYNFDIR
jgi:TonB family protein